MHSHSLRTRHANRQARAELAKRGPVGKALSIEAMRQHLLTVSIDIYMRTDGEPAVDLLSHLAWMVGIGAEIACRVMPGTAEARNLHAALRTIVALSAAGCAWQATQAPVLHAAATASKDLMCRHADIGMAMVPGADALAAAIKDGSIKLDDVAGAEVYATAAGGA